MLDYIKSLLTHLVDSGVATRAELAGSHRRGVDSHHDVDIVVETANRAAVESEICARVGVDRYKQTQNRSFFPPGTITPHLDVVFASGDFESQMLTWTGNATFNIACRSKAKGMGLKLNEHGLWNGDQLIETTEAGILKALGMEHHLDPATRSL